MYRTVLFVLALVIATHGLQLLPTSSKVVKGTASSFYDPSQSPEQLIAGTGTWNSGRWGTGWIQFNLGAPFLLTSLTLTCDQTIKEHTIHTVYAGTNPDNLQSIVTFDGFTVDKQLLHANFNLLRAQYVKVVTTLTQDWIAWKNVSLFGERANNQIKLLPTNSLDVSGRASSIADTKSTPDALITGTGPWNSGRWGVNWIQINLGAPYLLSNISLVCDQTVTDQTTHSVYGSKFGGDSFVLAEFDGITSNYQVLSASLPNVEAQYIKVVTTRTLDWVAWRNITLFGQPKRGGQNCLDVDDTSPGEQL